MIQSEFYLTMLERYGGSSGLKKAGRNNARRWIRGKKGLGSAH